MPNHNVSAGREAFQVNVRIPHELRDRVRAIALAERRSFGSQIVVLLERAISSETKTATGAETPIAAK